MTHMTMFDISSVESNSLLSKIISKVDNPELNDILDIEGFDTIVISAYKRNNNSCSFVFKTKGDKIKKFVSFLINEIICDSKDGVISVVRQDLSTKLFITFEKGRIVINV